MDGEHRTIVIAVALLLLTTRFHFQPLHLQCTVCRRWLFVAYFNLRRCNCRRFNLDVFVTLNPNTYKILHTVISCFFTDRTLINVYEDANSFRMFACDLMRDDASKLISQ